MNKTKFPLYYTYHFYAEAYLEISWYRLCNSANAKQDNSRVS